ncbi:hypothetical protein POV26_06640 [Aequorivita todarodis]|uniref:hypothetical protein n=1 Tax=Aequorivita todarodis TaxID=2036821 RepID=UPI002350C692|nr:hypothetical protein [Aequorivita todarodis]MDC8000707.1 hypothetical protein [Aequorivita todarodis]
MRYSVAPQGHYFRFFKTSQFFAVLPAPTLRGNLEPSRIEFGVRYSPDSYRDAPQGHYFRFFKTSQFFAVLPAPTLRGNLEPSRIEFGVRYSPDSYRDAPQGRINFALSGCKYISF